MEFKKYRRKQVAELRPITKEDIYAFKTHNKKLYVMSDSWVITVSISQADIDNGSPKLGDMIARNSKNHKDQWLVAKEYFEENFEEI